MKQRKADDLAKHRYRIANDHLNAARILLENGYFRDSVSRSYYAVLTAARSLLALRGLEGRTHKGVISLFNQHFIKTGILPKQCSSIFGQAQAARWESDYSDVDATSKEYALTQFNNATTFLAETRKQLVEELGSF